MDKRQRNRLVNARALIEKHGGTKAFAMKVGKSASTVSQMTGPNPTRGITSDTAREWERICEEPEGSLDWHGGAVPPQAPATPSKGNGAPHTAESTPQGATTLVDTASIINMLVAVWSEQPGAAPTEKFGQIAAYAISEAQETGHAPTHATLKRLIALLR